MNKKVTEETLKPCPFCGEMPEIRRIYPDWCIYCNNYSCGANPSVLDSPKNKAIKIWNTRKGEK